MFSEKELKLLGSTKGLEHLLSGDKPNFKDIVKELRYARELQKLQIELIKVQNWVVENGERILILVEGREFAGKGGTISSFVEHLNPRPIRLVALQTPTPKQKGQWYFKRYVENLPEKEEMVFFDRSWYNRAIVEPVNEFCTKKEYKKFMGEVNFI